jgi:hypothetical protein
MQLPRRMIGVAFAVAVVGLLSFLLLQSREPTYQGRSLSAWLQDWDNSSTRPGTPVRTEVRTNVQNAVRQMGEKAVPCLRSMLRTRDTAVRQKLVAFCSQKPWIPIRFRPAAYRLHIRGMFGIRALGPAGKPALPELLALLKEPEWTIRAWAAGTLGKIGPDANVALPELTLRLSDPDCRVRQSACSALPEIGIAKEVVLPALMPCLQDTNDSVFVAALQTTSQLGVDPSALVPSVTRQLTQADPRVRYEAAMALQRWGDNARPAIPALLKAAQDPDKDVREAAAKALIKIDPPAAVEAKIPTPPGPAPDAEAGSVTLEMQGPTSMALEIYKGIAGVQLVMKFQGPVPGRLDIRATRPLSPKEAIEFLEKALLHQCGIVLEHIDEKNVAVKMRHQK